MRAPRFVREFFGWRWATCVALIAAALAFVVFALLLIPTQIGGAPVEGTGQVAFAPVEPVKSESVLRAPVPIARAAEGGDTAPSALGASAPLARAPAPAPQVAGEPNEPRPQTASDPDFAQNIADRADRPTRPMFARSQSR